MNRLYGWYAAFILGALLLQATVVEYLQIGNWKPDLVLIAIVIFATQGGRRAGSTAGFFIGLLSDLISGGLLGLGALTKSITGYLGGSLSRFWHERSQFVLILLICGLVHDLLFFYIDTLGQPINWWVLLRFHIIPNLLYTAIVGSLLFLFVKQVVHER